MKMTRRAVVVVLAAAFALGEGLILAQQGVRSVPARNIAAPDTVSPAMRSVIGGPLSPIWNRRLTSAAEWKALITQRESAATAALLDLKRRLSVKVEPTVIGGVKVFIVTPESVATNNTNRLLFHLHGGGYVFGRGEWGTREAILMASFGRIKVVSVDYRMPPDFPYPAALDDATAAQDTIPRIRCYRRFTATTGGSLRRS